MPILLVPEPINRHNRYRLPRDRRRLFDRCNPFGCIADNESRREYPSSSHGRCIIHAVNRS